MACILSCWITKNLDCISGIVHLDFQMKQFNSYDHLNFKNPSACRYTSRNWVCINHRSDRILLCSWGSMIVGIWYTQWQNCRCHSTAHRVHMSLYCYQNNVGYRKYHIKLVRYSFDSVLNTKSRWNSTNTFLKDMKCILWEYFSISNRLDHTFRILSSWNTNDCRNIDSQG